MGMVKALESEIFHAHDRIFKIQEQIESLKRQDANDQAHCHDIQVCLDRLRIERDDLMRKMQHLNRTYDNCVTEITRERQQMHLHNKHHSKLLVAKSLFQVLEVMQLSRKQDAINEFFTYCRFDQKCHMTLKTFVNVLERLGHFKMRIAIKQWH
jgi:chromosome segregation ATPase